MKDQIYRKLKDEMEKTITTLDKSFSRVRTGRASVSLLDGIKVDYYGAQLYCPFGFKSIFHDILSGFQLMSLKLLRKNGFFLWRNFC